MQENFSRYEIKILPARTDNYAIFIIDHSDKTCVTIDTPCARVIANFVDQNGLSLRSILNTHHHPDHVGGNTELKEKYSCTIIANGADFDRIPCADIAVKDGEVLQIFPSGLKANIIATDGHTIGHIVYFCPELTACFVGDTIFSLGCGKLFEGTPRQMRESLAKIASLPEETLLYCAHEYTLSNLRFVRHLFPEDQALVDFETEIKNLRIKNLPSVPTTLSKEKRFNPFLQTDQSGLKKRLIARNALRFDEMQDTNRVFAVLRELKDKF